MGLYSARGQDGWTRHFRAGLQVGLNIKADFKMSGEFGISGSNPSEPGARRQQHLYDDGYVRVDQTGNADGLTSFWGYEDASQYDAAAHTLTFSSARSFTTSGSASRDDQPYLGLDMAYGGNLTRWAHGMVGWELGFGLLPIHIKDNQELPGSFTRTRHRFDTESIVVPAAPYNGGPSGLGPTISDMATQLPDSAVNGTVTGSKSLDLNLYSIRLGPTLHWELHRRLATALGAGGALGIVSGDYLFDEKIVLTDGRETVNKGKFGRTEMVYGGCVAATLIFHVNEQADIYVAAQYMSLGDFSISGEGRQARLNLGEGLSLAAGINWPF